MSKAGDKWNQQGTQWRWEKETLQRWQFWVRITVGRKYLQKLPRMSSLTFVASCYQKEIPSKLLSVVGLQSPKRPSENELANPSQPSDLGRE